jgi:drug/metabolite transporter (DMT)-like permease
VLAQAPATETLQYQLLGAAAWLLPAAAFSGQWHWTVNATTLAHLGFQAVVISFASFLVWFWLLRVYLASQLGVFSFVTPLTGVVLGVWLLGERLEPHFIAGSALVLAGVVCVSGQAAIARGLSRVISRISPSPAPSRQ